MRPLNRLPLLPTVFQHPATALLMQCFGEYCSFCERPLPVESWAWNKRTGQSTEGPIAPEAWPDALLVCHNCHAAAESQLGPPYDSLIFPDEQSTFFLSAESPFTYALETVELTYLDEAGTPVEAPQMAARVIVTGHSPGAVATIRYFQLNTAYYDAETRHLRIPWVHHLSLVDRRLDQRTEAWNRAVKLAEGLATMNDPQQRSAMYAVARHIVAASGFWSTWATVLAQQFADRAVIEQIMLQPRRASRRQSTDRSAEGLGAGPGPHNVHPGTRRDWLR